MSLQDHFRPPLSVERHWHGFHNAWATFISSHLNALLPDQYFAEPNVKFGVEIDVATWEYDGGGSRGAVATWTAPAPTLSVPITMDSEIVEVLVFDREAGPTLAGAIELVSPANKDRAAHRDAFVSKCAAYLQQGIGLVIVDVVTSRKANLHEKLLKRVHAASVEAVPGELYAVAYRPVQRDERDALDIWQEPLAIGESLPTLPLWLRGNLCFPVDLDETYNRTCREQRLLVKDA